MILIDVDDIDWNAVPQTLEPLTAGHNEYV